MADTNAENITDAAVTDAGKYLVYSVFIAIANIVALIILVFLVTMILKKFGLSGIFGRGG